MFFWDAPRGPCRLKMRSLWVHFRFIFRKQKSIKHRVEFRSDFQQLVRSIFTQFRYHFRSQNRLNVVVECRCRFCYVLSCPRRGPNLKKYGFASVKHTFVKNRLFDEPRALRPPRARFSSRRGGGSEGAEAEAAAAAQAAAAG